MPDTRPDPRAVHCPHCHAAPGEPCRSPSGEARNTAHNERLHLAYALMFPEANFYRAEAERYRLQHPDVEPTFVICAPSRRQALWWNQWGRNLIYNKSRYESEHGPDIEGGGVLPCSHPLCRTAATPASTCGCACDGANHGRDGNTAEDEGEVVISANELLEQIKAAQKAAPVRKRTVRKQQQ